MKYPVEKKIDHELPVPTEWRPVISQIVSSIKLAFDGLDRIEALIKPISDHDKIRIISNIDEYGDVLDCLSQETWDTSIYQYDCDGWKVLVDLFTFREGMSDLVMFLRITENQGSYVFEIEDIHVP